MCHMPACMVYVLYGETHTHIGYLFKTEGEAECTSYIYNAREDGSRADSYIYEQYVSEQLMKAC